jgi:hypothetical protein
MSAHDKEQVWRAVRLFLFALLTQAAALDLHHLTRSAVIAALVAAAEVVFRQWKPATTDEVGTAGEPA